MVKEKEHGCYQTIDYMIACLEVAKENQLQKKMGNENKNRERITDWNWYKIHRTPNNALIKENLRNVGRTGFKLAKDLEVGE